MNRIWSIQLKFLFAWVILPVFAVQAMAAPQYKVALISEDTGIRTDRRPIHVGFHDAGVNETFVSWMGADSRAIVKAYDHATNTWGPDTVVGESPFMDKHNYPGMIRGVDDRLYVFYGCHNSTLKMTVSPNPLSIEGTWNDRFIEEATGASYPAPIITVDGVMYVFYRDTRQTNGHSDDRPYQYVKSTDNGKTWGRHMAIDPYPRADNLTEIYNGMVTYEPPHGDQKAKIHLAWTICGGGPERHAHGTYGKDVYYAWLNPVDDHLYNVAGVDLGDWIDDAEAQKHCKVLDTGDEFRRRGQDAGLQISAHYRDNGTPLVHFQQRRLGLCTAAWNGTTWDVNPIPGARGEPKGLEKFGPDSFRVFNPTRTGIRVYQTADAGKNWTVESEFEVGQSLSRCLLIDSYHPDAKLLMTSFSSGRRLRQAQGDVFIGKVSCVKTTGNQDAVSENQVGPFVQLAAYQTMAERPVVDGQQLVADETPFAKWHYYKELKFNTSPTGADVKGAVKNFPVAIALNAENFDFSQAKADSSDIRFSGKADTEPLAYSIEHWDGAAKTALVWVKVSTVQGNSTSQSIFMHWGNAAATDAADSHAVFNVDDGFVGVWHLDEEGNVAKDGYKDATANAAQGTGVNLKPGSRVPARAGNGIQLKHAQNQWVKVESEKRKLFDLTNKLTFSIWAKAHSYANEQAEGSRYLPGYETMFAKGDNSWRLQKFGIRSWHTPPAELIEMCVEQPPRSDLCVVGEIDMKVNQWYHFVGVHDHPYVQLYVNGKLDKVEIFDAPWKSDDHPVGIGNQSQFPNGGRSWDGILDEARVINHPKDEYWIKLDYESQKEEQKFLTFGPTQTRS